MAFTTKTKIKNAINAILNPLGFDLQTTLRYNLETTRLNELVAAGHWSSPRYFNGIKLDSEQQLEFLSEVVAPYKQSYAAFPINKGDADPGQFYLDNDFFGSVDTEVLYAIIRHHHPERIVEIGSGNSTKVMKMAIAAESLSTQITSIDPTPRVSVAESAQRWIASRVELLPATQIFDTLKTDDVLFIDSSHEVLAGGDVPFLFLEVLPRLAAGVLIHIHDMFLPFDYPQKWVVDRRWTLNEQYLVHAFLCFNPCFEILWASNYMWQTQKTQLLSVIRCSETAAVPASLWIRRR